MPYIQQIMEWLSEASRGNLEVISEASAIKHLYTHR